MHVPARYNRAAGGSGAPTMLEAATLLIWSALTPDGMVVPSLVVTSPRPGLMAPAVLLVATGRSLPWSARKSGAAALPLAGPAKTVLAVCVASVSARVPLVVTGLPAT